MTTTDQHTTVRSYGLAALAQTEMDAARSAYFKVLEICLANPTPENRAAEREEARKLDAVRKELLEARRSLLAYVAAQQTKKQTKRS